MTEVLVDPKRLLGRTQERVVIVWGFILQTTSAMIGYDDRGNMTTTDDTCA
jgi:hypothetical protein